MYGTVRNRLQTRATNSFMVCRRGRGRRRDATRYLRQPESVGRLCRSVGRSVGLCHHFYYVTTFRSAYRTIHRVWGWVCSGGWAVILVLHGSSLSLTHVYNENGKSFHPANAQ